MKRWRCSGPAMMLLLELWTYTAAQPCRICGPPSPDRACLPRDAMTPPEGVKVQSSICSEIENNHKDYHNSLCKKYPKPNGYYYECTIPGTTNTFSCRSSCGPPLEDVGKGLNLDLLQGGGLLGTFNNRPQNRGTGLFDFNNFNNDRSRGGNLNFGNFATLNNFNANSNSFNTNNNNNFGLFKRQGANTGTGNSQSNVRTKGRSSNKMGGASTAGASVTSGGGRMRGSNSGGTSSYTSSSSSSSGGGSTLGNIGASLASANMAGQEGSQTLNNLGNSLSLGRGSSGYRNSGFNLFNKDAAGKNNNNAFNLVGSLSGTNDRALNFGSGLTGASNRLNGNTRKSETVSRSGINTGARSNLNSRDFNKNFDVSTLKPVESQRSFDNYYNNFNDNFQNNFANLLKKDSSNSGSATSSQLSAGPLATGLSHQSNYNSNSAATTTSGGADANLDATSNYGNDVSSDDVSQNMEKETTEDPLSYITPVDSLVAYPPLSEDVLQAPPMGDVTHGHVEHSPGVTSPREAEGALALSAQRRVTSAENEASFEHGVPEVGSAPISGGVSGTAPLSRGPPPINQVPPATAQLPPQPVRPAPAQLLPQLPAKPVESGSDSYVRGPAPLEDVPPETPTESVQQLSSPVGSEDLKNYADEASLDGYTEEDLVQSNPSIGPSSTNPENSDLQSLPGEETALNYLPPDVNLRVETPKEASPDLLSPSETYPTDLGSDEVYPGDNAPESLSEGQPLEKYSDSSSFGPYQDVTPPAPQTYPDSAYPEERGSSMEYPEQEQPVQNLSSGPKTLDVPDTSVSGPYPPAVDQSTLEAADYPVSPTARDGARDGPLPPYSQDDSPVQDYPDFTSPQDTAKSEVSPRPQEYPPPRSSPSDYSPSSSDDFQGAADAYESAKQDSGFGNDDAFPVGTAAPGERQEEGAPVVVVDEGRDDDETAESFRSSSSQSPPPGIYDVPNDDSQKGGSQTPSSSSSDPTDPNFSNNLPPEAFRNPFRNPASPFSRRADRFDSNPAYVGTSLFGETFLDSPDNTNTMATRPRGPDAVDVGGNQIFPGFQQFEKTGATDVLGVNNNNDRQNNIFSIFTQPAGQTVNRPSLGGEPSQGGFGFGGAGTAGNPGSPAILNSGFGGFASQGRRTQGPGGVFSPDFVAKAGNTVLSGFPNQANGNNQSPFPANPSFPATGRSTQPSPNFSSFPGPQPSPGRGVASSFHPVGQGSKSGAEDNGFSGSRRSKASGFPSAGSGAARFPSSRGGTSSSRPGVDRTGFVGFGSPNAEDKFGFPGSFGNFNDQGFDNNNNFDDNFFSDELFNGKDATTEESEESTDDVKQSLGSPPEQTSESTSTKN